MNSILEIPAWNMSNSKIFPLNSRFCKCGSIFHINYSEESAVCATCGNSIEINKFFVKPYESIFCLKKADPIYYFQRYLIYHDLDLLSTSQFKCKIHGTFYKRFVIPDTEEEERKIIFNMSSMHDREIVIFNSNNNKDVYEYPTAMTKLLELYQAGYIELDVCPSNINEKCKLLSKKFSDFFAVSYFCYSNEKKIYMKVNELKKDGFDRVISTLNLN